MAADTALAGSGGAFFCAIPQHSVWQKLFTRKSLEKEVSSVIEPVVKRYSASLEEEGVLASLSRAPQFGRPHLSTFVFGSGGLAVRPGVGDKHSEGSLYTSPHVQYNRNQKHVVVLFGWVSNAAELLEQEGALHLGSPTSGASSDLNVSDQIDQSGSSSLATRVISALYDRLGPSADLLLLLTGQFALVVYDEAKGAAFAARSAVPGDDELFYSVGDGDGVMFTNSLHDLPPHAADRVWHAIPPGHFVSGKDPVLTQFALTREQLAQRAAREDSGEDLEDIHISYDTALHESPSHATSLIRRFSKRLSDHIHQ